MSGTCTGCGAANAEAARFCTRCGAPLDVPAGGAALPASAPGDAVDEAPPHVPGSKAFIYGGIASGLVALIVVGGGGLWWGLRHPGRIDAPAVAAASAVAPSTPVVAAAPPAAKTVPAAATAAAEVPRHPAPQQAPTHAVAATGASARVGALRQALAACAREGNFFHRQLCIQQARWHYCGAPLAPDPLWGKVAECPESAQRPQQP